MDTQEPHAGGLLDTVVAKWSVLTAMATFAVYVLGYLAVRFQVTALGVGSDLELVSERYLSEGAKFLIFLVSTVPILAVVALPLAAIAWLTLRALPTWRSRLARCWAYPVIPLSAGILLSLTMIQFVMRQCFAFHNLLLCDALPGPTWFRDILTDPGDLNGQRYFTLLVATILVAAGLAFAVGSWQAAPLAQRVLFILLVFLVGIQVLLLPVNYGVLMAARLAPRLAPNPETIALEAGARTWLIWEGTTAVTFLVHDSKGERKLVTVPRDKVARIDIVGYDLLTELRAKKMPIPPPSLAWTWAKLEKTFAGPSPKTRQSRPPARGNLFHVSSEGGRLHPLTKAGDFHSPLYLPGDDSLIALKGDRLVRVDLDDPSEPKEMAQLLGATRLIGIDPKNPNAVLVLAEGKVGATVKHFDLQSKQLTPVALDAANDGHDELVDNLRGDDRERDQTRLTVRQRDDNSTWTDIFIQHGKGPEVNLSQGTRENSRQPTLSHNGKFVAFVKVASSF